MIGRVMLRCQAVVLSVAAIASVSLAGEDVLIIPDILTGTVGMYDVEDGEYLGDIVPDDGHLGEIHCAVQGPDNLIYVSDQIKNEVFRYNLDGTFVDSFVNVELDGHIAPKGMAFWFDEETGRHSLLVGVLIYDPDFPWGPYDGRIARYLDDGTYDPDFLDGKLFPSVVFDMEVDDEKNIWYALVGDWQIDWTNGGIGRIDPSGQDLGLVMWVRGPYQVVRIPSTGNLLAAAFGNSFFQNEPMFVEFEPDGDVLAGWVIPGPLPAPHGIEKLGNGLYLSVGDSGIWRVDPADGFSTTLMRSGTGFRMVNRATLPGACPFDLDGDGNVGTGDLVVLLGSWGDPYGAADLIELLGNWGRCPK